MVSDGLFLVLFRPKRGEYRLPKGHIEPNESPEETAVREVREESGYSVEILADLGEQTVEFDWQDCHYLRRDHFYLMKRVDGQECGAAEAQFEPLWLSFEEALSLLTFAAEKEWLRRSEAALDALNG